MKTNLSRVFVDTSGWYALVDSSDQYHQEAKTFFQDLTASLITSDYVLDETLTLLRKKISHDVAVKFGRKLQTSSLSQMLPLTDDDREEAWKRFVTYTDEHFSFTDCTSFAIMNRMEIEYAFTFDSDFRIPGYKLVP